MVRASQRSRTYIEPAVPDRSVNICLKEQSVYLIGRAECQWSSTATLHHFIVTTGGRSFRLLSTSFSVLAPTSNQIGRRVNSSRTIHVRLELVV